ncbi:tetratricopeptide repeat protein [Clostridium sp. 19966]|uniref:tetratricopeptide repeat protein n=1 Tax=Clostridium sp. 19966 TaxID=2768166 RepID=UPI0028E03F54|nr:tetratricopeptide repeat protein [Clostridium sp. 19966]MDT8715858.1 tetratricopeptide repeat protein [Clostridium sp. 19966]
MNKGKYYKKATSLYNKGEIDKAIKLCEKIISMDLKNSAVLNLKGLLLYLKGDIEDAESLWKINKYYNNDKVSQKYLQGVEKDRLKLDMYNQSLQLITELRINEAVLLLETCRESDFNLINVCNTLAACYIKQGKYQEAEENINKVFSIDIKNKEALSTKKILIEYGILKKNNKNFKILSAAFISCVLIIGIYGYYNILNKSSLNSKNNKAISNTVSVPEKQKVSEPAKSSTNNSANTSLNTANTNVQDQFPSDKLKDAVNKNSFDDIYDIVKQYKDYSGNEDNKILINQSISLLQQSGSKYFYDTAREKHKANQYEAAISYYNKCLEYNQDENIKPDLIFMIADCYKNLNNIDKATEFYDQYLKFNSQNGYQETALYEMVLIYKDRDKEKAKAYAESLINKYPKSIYNNSIVKAVLNQ